MLARQAGESVAKAFESRSTGWGQVVASENIEMWKVRCIDLAQDRFMDISQEGAPNTCNPLVEFGR